MLSFAQSYDPEKKECDSDWLWNVPKSDFSQRVCVCVSELSRMDGVPLRMPQGASQQVQEDVHVIVPDYLTRLQDTEVSGSWQTD